MAIGVQTTSISFDVTRERIENSIPIQGDKAVAEAAIKRVAQHILKNIDPSNKIRGVLNKLTIAPLSASECRLAIQLINQHSLIAVVDNSHNKDPGNGRIRVTREYTIGVDENEHTALIGNHNVTGLQQRTRRELQGIGVSQMAWGAIRRHSEALNKVECTCCCSIL